MCEGLPGSGRQVVLAELRGHGDSSEPFDATAYGPIHCSWDMIAVLDHAGIRRADLLGYGVGGRIALCMAAFAPDRVHAVGAGGAHPFAERVRLSGDAWPNGLEPWLRMIKKKAAKARQPASGNPVALADAVMSDWPDIADAVARSGVPILLFVEKEDPCYPLILSFAERSGARVVTVAEDGSATTGLAPERELSSILEFFQTPEGRGPAEPLPLCLWSGSWA